VAEGNKTEILERLIDDKRNTLRSGARAGNLNPNERAVTSSFSWFGYEGKARRKRGFQTLDGGNHL
ncbi:unnamed protein product, partial [Linum tenue]